MERELSTKYIQRIQEAADMVKSAEHAIQENKTSLLEIKNTMLASIEDIFREKVLWSIEQLRKYYQGVEYFSLLHGEKSVKEQVGTLFGFSSEKFRWAIHMNQHWPVFQIVFSDMQDLLSVKFSKRKETFTQEDRSSWFFKVVRFDEYQIPVCVSINEYPCKNIVIHEMTHFRHSIIGMDYYSTWWGVDAYERVVYDDIQEEILAFFSEWIGKADVILSILHDPRYHFYRRLDSSSYDREEIFHRFSKDVREFIDIARSVKTLRGERYLYDLSFIPIKKWKRYLRYLQENNKNKENLARADF